jgi:hypothetical protein
MARNALNYFEPYENLPPHHENQLTRALVVVLRLSPLAHAAWLRRVDPDLALYGLPDASSRSLSRTRSRVTPTTGRPDDSTSAA